MRAGSEVRSRYFTVNEVEEWRQRLVVYAAVLLPELVEVGVHQGLQRLESLVRRVDEQLRYEVDCERISLTPFEHLNDKGREINIRT